MYVVYGQGQHSTPALRGKAAKACIMGTYGYKVGALGMVRTGIGRVQGCRYNQEGPQSGSPLL